MIVPFAVHVDDDVLDDLRARLTRTRFADQIEGTGWEYGVPLDYLRELVAYWRNDFDWAGLRITAADPPPQANPSKRKA